MAVVRWSSDFTLTSYLGSLAIPAAMLIPGNCSSGVDLRITSDPVPAEDGAIFRRRFKNSYQIHLSLQLIADGAPQTDAGLQSFYDELMAHLDALLEYDGRISWPVAGGGSDRMLEDVRTLERPGPTGTLPKQFDFSLESPFPYAWDAPETDTPLVDSTPVTVTRVGSAKEFWPVVQVPGAISSAFQLKNTTLGLEVDYDPSLPGAPPVDASHLIEFDFFRKTAVLKLISTGAAVDFLDEGVVWIDSDFWPLVPGANVIELDGADGTLKWQDAWA